MTRPMTQTEARLRRFKSALRQVTIELRDAQLAKNPDLVVDLLDQRDQLVKVIEELELQS